MLEKFLIFLIKTCNRWEKRNLIKKFNGERARYDLRSRTLVLGETDQELIDNVNVDLRLLKSGWKYRPMTESTERRLIKEKISGLKRQIITCESLIDDARILTKFRPEECNRDIASYLDSIEKYRDEIARWESCL